MESATAEREETHYDEEPGLEPGEDDGTGIPGGAQPGDDDYDELAAKRDEGPPTPPADLPDDEPDAEADESGQTLLIAGERTLGLKVGGREPDSSVFKLKGCKIDLDGQFDRGDRFLAVTILQVTGDNDQDTIDTLSGEVKSTSKAQGATLCGISRIEDYLAAKIKDRGLLEQVADALELEIGSEV